MLTQVIWGWVLLKDHDRMRTNRGHSIRQPDEQKLLFAIEQALRQEHIRRSKGEVGVVVVWRCSDRSHNVTLFRIAQLIGKAYVRHTWKRGV